ncbi:MAG TPA: (Fe-S)-binding protein [Actinomycetota bacterium]|jgi:L-lactate dehydrogenase complex protein LldE|nr:(Fe-S)-binding protein [Actinomycetota bacterium]
MRVTLFPTCLADLLFPQAAGAARRVLERAGVEVDTAAGAVCCGQPAWNSGHVEEARRVASGTLDALKDRETVVLCSGSCTSMIHEYWPALFAGTDREPEARGVAERVREFSSFADEVLPEDAGGETSIGPACYHDSCHMLRMLRISEAPRNLLARAKVDLHELGAGDRCCGFGGTFSLRYPDLSSAMADEKVDDALAAGAGTVVASDLGCLMQIVGRARARGVALEGRYIAEVIDEALGDR